MVEDTAIGRVAIFTGKGSLPREIAGSLQRHHKEPFLVGIKTEHESWIKGYDHVLLHWGQFGRFFKALRQAKVTHILFAGGLTRPTINFLRMDFGALPFIAKVLTLMLGGDNTLLSGLIKVIESNGIKVLGAHEVMPELLANTGVIAGKKPGKKSMRNIEQAVDACRKLGELDIGQGAVAVGGRVVALEGIEGTDEMLRRIADLRKSGRLVESGRFGVLAKTMKPQQDMRADLPAIGPDTIENAHKAGLAGIAVEADHSLILEREKTLELARKHNIFIFGVEKTGGI
ncbi:MAG: UDP-2,3-diacylglucosamine diphosphatase LpxI [Rhizobiaceae bacterium]|nr:UDP-2,3-diacylglucosamine diphosphatase LpxI [Rhizobiaceae bacterium]